MWRKFFDRRRSVLRFRVSSVQWSNIIVHFSALIISSQMMWKLPFKWFPNKGFYVPRMTRCDWRHPRKISILDQQVAEAIFLRSFAISCSVYLLPDVSVLEVIWTGFCRDSCPGSLLNIGRKIPLIMRHYMRRAS
jgi:hypothetical protein